jgi:nucleotide-binding universal stress UspA family protein
LVWPLHFTTVASAAIAATPGASMDNTYRRILVAIDCSDVSSPALKEAIKLAKGQQAALRIVHVIDAVNFDGDALCDTEATLGEMASKALRSAEAEAGKAGVLSETRLLSPQQNFDEISDAILKDAVAWNADVIVMGTHGRRGLNRFLLGSVAEAVVRSSRIPVLLIRGEAKTERKDHVLA